MKFEKVMHSQSTRLESTKVKRFESQVDDQREKAIASLRRWHSVSAMQEQIRGARLYKKLKAPW